MAHGIDEKGRALLGPCQYPVPGNPGGVCSKPATTIAQADRRGGSTERLPVCDEHFKEMQGKVR